MVKAEIHWQVSLHNTYNSCLSAQAPALDPWLTLWNPQTRTEPWTEAQLKPLSGQEETDSTAQEGCGRPSCPTGMQDASSDPGARCAVFL